MKGFRTLAFNLLTFAAALFTWPGLSEFIDPQYVVLGAAIANVALRFVTTTPVGKSGGGL